MGNIEILNQWRFYTYVWPWLTGGEGLDFTKDTIKLVVDDVVQEWTVLQTDWNEDSHEMAVLTLADPTGSNHVLLKLWATPLRQVRHTFGSIFPTQPR